MRYDILSIVNDLIHQTAADNLPVLPKAAPSPEPEPVPYIATNAAGNSNDEMIKIYSETTTTNDNARKFPPPNQPDIPQNRVRHKRTSISK